MASIYNKDSKREFSGTLIMKELKTRDGKRTFNKFLLADRNTETGETTFYQLKWKMADNAKLSEYAEAHDRWDVNIYGNAVVEKQEGTDYTNNIIWVDSMKAHE